MSELSPEFIEAINSPMVEVPLVIDVNKTVFKLIAGRQWKNGYLQDFCQKASEGVLDWSLTDLSQETDKNLKERKKYICYLES